jgi:hypothetical protein
MGASCYASDNRLVITDGDAEFGVFLAPQTQGLLSRGSQVRALPGAPIPKEIPPVSSGKKFAGEASSKKVTGLASSRPELRTFVID